jgi:hypothetical protein
VNPYPMTVGGFDRPSAQLLNFPILSRNPWISTVLNYRIYDSRIARSRLQSVAESRDRCVSGNKRWVTNKGCISGESTALGL